MLRLIVLLLLLANGAYFAWSQGLLLAWGLGPAQQSEPHRLRQQIRPEAVRVVSGDEISRGDTSTVPARAAPAECLQAGPVEDGEIESLRQALQGWPAGSWVLEPSVEPARWIVYMGKYPSPESVTRKRGELRQIGVSFEPLANADLEPGLSLGGFPSQAQAVQLLDRLAERGVRTARVVQERAELRGQRLMLPAVDEALRSRVDELRPALGTRSLRPCR